MPSILFGTAPEDITKFIYRELEEMDDVKRLLEIQNLEDKIREIEKQTKLMPEFRELKNLKQDIENCQAEARQMNEEVVESKEALREIEMSLAVLREKVERANIDLYSGATNNIKEIEAVRKNIEMTREKIQEGEDRALKIMEILEENEKSLRKLLNALDDKKKEFRKMHQHYNEKKLELARLHEMATQQRDALLKELTPEMLNLYENISQKFANRKGVALLKNSVCSGCNMAVSFDLLRQAKVKGTVLTCDNCGRLLVSE